MSSGGGAAGGTSGACPCDAGHRESSRWERRGSPVETELRHGRRPVTREVSFGRAKVVVIPQNVFDAAERRFDAAAPRSS